MWYTFYGYRFWDSGDWEAINNIHGYKFLDTDDYFWFRQTLIRDERIGLVKKDIEKKSDKVLYAVGETGGFYYSTWLSG